MNQIKCIWLIKIKKTRLMNKDYQYAKLIVYLHANVTTEATKNRVSKIFVLVPLLRYDLGACGF